MSSKPSHLEGHAPRTGSRFRERDLGQQQRRRELEPADRPVGHSLGAAGEHVAVKRRKFRPDLRHIDRLGQIDNPVVRTKPSDAAIPVKKKKRRASEAHAGE